eukprot:1769615-Prymnesium_polylepis.1
MASATFRDVRAWVAIPWHTFAGPWYGGGGGPGQLKDVFLRNRTVFFAACPILSCLACASRSRLVVVRASVGTHT